MKTWAEWFNQQSQAAYSIALETKIKTAYAQNQCLPQNRADLFRALKLTPAQNLKVVILGQDPYPNPKYATGLAFSVPNSIQNLPESLKNIFLALKADYPATILNHGDLTAWAKQGVLLLNTVLTVKPYAPFSHQTWEWNLFTHQLMQFINQLPQPIVFLLWGKNAQKYFVDITAHQHLILQTSHPSPLSAYRGFLTAHHFKLTNQFLKQEKITPINWNLY